MPAYRLQLAYDGTDFHGWQKQHQPEDFAGAPRLVEGADAGTTEDGRTRRALRTVQQAVEDAVFDVVRARISVQGASRTDSGVHARAQTAVFTTDDDRLGPPDERLAMALNSRLPEDVLVTACARAPSGFDPIAHCIAKGYRYTIHASPTRPLWNRRYAAHVRRGLDVEAMRDAAALIVGEHDFAAFAAAGHGRESTVRTVHACTVQRLDDETIAIDASADGFLYNMVRIIAGTLVDVGLGKKVPADVERALRTGDRREAGTTMPAHGLCLMWGRYPEPVGVVGDAHADAVPPLRRGDQHAW